MKLRVGGTLWALGVVLMDPKEPFDPVNGFPEWVRGLWAEPVG